MEYQWNTKEQQNTEHRQNSGTPQNSGGTTEQSGIQAEHPRIPTEHQRKTRKTSLNNGTIQKKEQLLCAFFKYQPHFHTLTLLTLLKVEISYIADINSSYIADINSYYFISSFLYLTIV